MTSDELTHVQLQKLEAELLPGFDYLRRLRDRMAATYFPFEDSLYVRVKRATEAMENLLKEIRKRKGSKKPHTSKGSGP